ncbi:MAG TPA: hypothetical protein VKY90_18750 [Candidatus Dormibacteraeota bacterium]|nr:hypothetical protein [Candidatus Dormibacteraeota bacterium]
MMISAILATTAVAVDQLQGPSGTTWWLYLLAGAGLGSVMAAGVNLLGGRWQRNHELLLERMRDQRKLRDTRLERLRDDFRCVVEITRAIDQVAMPAMKLEEAAEVRAKAALKVSDLRPKLDLDPIGTKIGSQLSDLVELAWRYIVDAQMAAQLGQQMSDRAIQVAKSSEESRRKLLESSKALRECVRQALQNIENGPLAGSS